MICFSLRDKIAQDYEKVKSFSKKNETFCNLSILNLYRSRKFLKLIP